eukprot:m.92176 g.92176  ORF g.92176 m.92176 type:complete len:105 (+) comp8502_c1_seq4:128-442(+)
MVLEELVPKESGREARIDKKRAETQARREREASPEANDKDLMGGGPDFKAEMERKRNFMALKHIERREEALDKIAAYREKERSKMAEFLELARVSKAQNALWQG